MIRRATGATEPRPRTDERADGEASNTPRSDPSEAREQFLRRRLHIGPRNGERQQQFHDLVLGQPLDAVLLEPAPQALPMPVVVGSRHGSRRRSKGVLLEVGRSRCRNRRVVVSLRRGGRPRKGRCRATRTPNRDPDPETSLRSARLPVSTRTPGAESRGSHSRRRPGGAGAHETVTGPPRIRRSRPARWSSSTAGRSVPCPPPTNALRPDRPAGSARLGRPRPTAGSSPTHRRRLRRLRRPGPPAR